MTRSEEDVPTFLPLAEYERPAGPASHIAQRVRDRVVRLLRRDDDRVVEDERLKRASRATIDDFTASPDCSLLARELDKTLGDWAEAADGATADRLRLVVVPPGDVRGVLETWAPTTAPQGQGQKPFIVPIPEESVTNWSVGARTFVLAEEADDRSEK